MARPQELINRVSKTGEEYGLRLNIEKTTYMVIAKSQVNSSQLKFGSSRIVQEHKYTYLGALINDQWDHFLEIKLRIEKARGAFKKLGKLIRSHALHIVHYCWGAMYFLYCCMGQRRGHSRMRRVNGWEPLICGCTVAFWKFPGWITYVSNE